MKFSFYGCQHFLKNVFLRFLTTEGVKWNPTIALMWKSLIIGELPCFPFCEVFVDNLGSLFFFLLMIFTDLKKLKSSFWIIIFFWLNILQIFFPSL